MGIKFKLLFPLAFFMIYSCEMIYHTAPDKLEENTIDFCFVDDSSVISSDRFLHQGYYRVYREDSLEMMGTLVNMIFFEDGAFVTAFSSISESGKELIPTHEYLKKVVNEEETTLSSSFYKHAYWGRYKVNSDTIKVKYINRPGLGSMNRHWYLTESKFQILDKGELKIIETNSILYENNPVLKKQVLTELNGKKAQFFKISQMPSSDSSWLKKEKWFWCSETEYEKWKNNMNR